MPFENDPLLSGFLQISAQKSSIDRGRPITIKIGDTIKRQRRRSTQKINFSKSGDPVLESVFKLLDQERYQLSWKKVILLGCSAGGDVALRSIFKQVRVPHLPILIVMHHNPGFDFLTRFDMKNNTYQRPIIVKEGTPIRGSRIYFTPGEQEVHLSGVNATFKTAPRVGKIKFRPDIDAVFASMGKYFKENCMGAILTGMLDDGAKGAKALSLNRGEVWVQNPATAMFKDMPIEAQKTVPLAKIGSLDQIADRINTLSSIYLELKPFAMFARK